MHISKVMLISIFITTVILGIVGGVTANSLQAAPKSSDTANAELVATYQQREAAYNQLIEEANQRLEKANAAIESLQSQADPAKLAAAPGQPAPSASITPEKASQIALQAVEAGQVVLKTPELVSFEGKAAYEVIFSKGSVYVNAQSGAIAFNGTVPVQITADKAVQIASDYMKDKDVLQVDQITFRNAPIYRVIFKSGMMVYMDTTGQISYIQKASTPAPVMQASAGSSGNTQASAPTSPKENHEDSGEHEGGD